MTEATRQENAGIGLRVPKSERHSVGLTVLSAARRIVPISFAHAYSSQSRYQEVAIHWSREWSKIRADQHRATQRICTNRLRAERANKPTDNFPARIRPRRRQKPVSSFTVANSSPSKPKTTVRDSGNRAQLKFQAPRRKET